MCNQIEVLKVRNELTKFGTNSSTFESPTTSLKIDWSDQKSGQIHLFFFFFPSSHLVVVFKCCLSPSHISSHILGLLLLLSLTLTLTATKGG
jgi:hypothetical protein